MRFLSIALIFLIFGCNATKVTPTHYVILEDNMFWCNSINTSDTSQNEILARYKTEDWKRDTLYQVWFDIYTNRKYINFNKNTRIYIK